MIRAFDAAKECNSERRRVWERANAALEEKAAAHERVPRRLQKSGATMDAETMAKAVGEDLEANLLPHAIVLHDMAEQGQCMASDDPRLR